MKELRMNSLFFIAAAYSSCAINVHMPSIFTAVYEHAHLQSIDRIVQNCCYEFFKPLQTY